VGGEVLWRAGVSKREEEKRRGRFDRTGAEECIRQMFGSKLCSSSQVSDLIPEMLDPSSVDSAL
jgi:hypothetical protein